MKVVAKTAFLLSLPELHPLDGVACEKVCADRCGPVEDGRVIRGEGLAVAFFAHAVKWPGAVAQFDRAISRDLGSVTGEHLVAGIFEALRWAHNKALVKMHDSMSFGRMHATTGLIIIAQQLCILSKPDKEDKRVADGVKILSLGKKSSPYILSDFGNCQEAIAYAEFVLETCRSVFLQWPNPSVLESFADSLLELANKLRSSRVDGAVRLTGGRKKARLDESELDAGYIVQHFTRMVLLTGVRAGRFGSLEEPSPPIDALLVGRIQTWLPDELGALQPFAGQTAGWLRQTFGLHPFLASCWACFAHTLDVAQQKKILAASDEELWGPVLTWQKLLLEHMGRDLPADIWPPTLKDISEAI